MVWLARNLEELRWKKRKLFPNSRNAELMGSDDLVVGKSRWFS
jgi:hypothetical protein